jgi:hypothetical protein
VEVSNNELRKLGNDINALAISANHLLTKMFADPTLFERLAMARKIRRAAADTVSTAGS